MNSIYYKSFRLVLLVLFCPCFCLTSLYHCNFDAQTSDDCLFQKTLDAPTLIRATAQLQDETSIQTLPDSISIRTYGFVKTPNVGAFDHTYAALVKNGDNSIQCLDFYYYITDSSYNARITVEWEKDSTRQPITELKATLNNKWQHCRYSYNRPSSSSYHVTAAGTETFPEGYVADETGASSATDSTSTTPATTSSATDSTSTAPATTSSATDSTSTAPATT
ncbi:unnamed protein product, partial [Rotaria sp. Silwood2]